MEEDLLADQASYQSHIPRNADLVRDIGSGRLKGLKNLNEDIRGKVTHIESLGLGILGMVKSVNYGSWGREPACLICLQFNHRGNASSAAFRNIEILVSCEPWLSRSSGHQPVLRKFSPRRCRVRLDHDQGTWGWEPLQRCWVATEPDSAPSHTTITNGMHATAGVFGTPWSSKRRMAPHQISWIVDNQSEGKWQIPDHLSFAFVVHYVSAFQATVEVKAKTNIGLPFPLVAFPWSRDEPLLFNGKTQVGDQSPNQEFDRLSDADWAEVAPYVPDWSKNTSKKQVNCINSVQLLEKAEKELRRETVYRVRGLPEDSNFSEMQKLIGLALLIEEQSIRMESLAESPYRREKIATVTFQQPSTRLVHDATESKDEWQFGVEYFSSGASDAKKGLYKQLPLVIDTHFHGFTPLNNAQNADSDYHTDFIALTGLGAHAFRSFKARGNSHMWIRDSLPFDLPGVRILTYGYDSHLFKNDSFQSISSIANQFLDALRAIRTSNPRRPIIFLGHSLGGLVIKQTLLSCALYDRGDLDILKSTYAVLFFGVLSQGMNIETLLPKVDGQPNRVFLESLDKVSETLMAQQTAFIKVFPTEGSELLCFYETQKSPTNRREDGDRWTMTGKPAVLVDPFSATQGSTSGFGLPMNRTHSDLVKFKVHDEDYERVLAHLRTCVERATATIPSRFPD